ncbi:hypothetical protein LINGRAHAP2_LOCUS31891 [Linum grandiflorum]
MEDSYRTIREVDEMVTAAGDLEPFYCCSVEIVGFDDHQPWFYKACLDCSAAVVLYSADFWCKKHDIVLSSAVTHSSRLPGCRWPTTSCPLNDDREKVVFGVHLPRQIHASTYEDFRISKIWGRNLPRDKLLAQLPPPRLPYRTPSSKSTKADIQPGPSKLASDDDTLLSSLRPRKQPPHGTPLLATPPTPTVKGTTTNRSPNLSSDIPHCLCQTGKPCYGRSHMVCQPRSVWWFLYETPTGTELLAQNEKCSLWPYHTNRAVMETNSLLSICSLVALPHFNNAATRWISTGDMLSYHSLESGRQFSIIGGIRHGQFGRSDRHDLISCMTKHDKCGFNRWIGNNDDRLGINLLFRSELFVILCNFLAEMYPKTTRNAQKEDDPAIPSRNSSFLWFLLLGWISIFSLVSTVAADLVQLNANIDDLDFGKIPIAFQELCIEGYTEPGGANAVRELLFPGAIYRMENPFLIPARRILRSCPGDFALQIRPGNLLDRIHENPAHPFFPLQSFNIVTMPRLRAVDQLRTSSSGKTYTATFLTEPFHFPNKKTLKVQFFHFVF